MPVTKSGHDRYLIIDRCITNKKYPSIDDLVDAIEQYLGIEISVSTVNKDIAQIKKIYNAPLQFHKEHNGYYYTETTFSIKNSPLTYEEMNTLELSVSLLQRMRGSNLFNQYEKAVEKLIQGNKLTEILGKKQNEIIQIENTGVTESNKWLEVIVKSIVEKNCLTVTYHPFGRQQKKHEFSAYLLKEYHNRWYAIGYIKNSKCTMVLAVDRVVSIEPCSEKYFSDEWFKPDEYFKYSIGITQIHDAVPQKVILSFAAEQKPYIVSQPLHHSQKVLKDNSKTFQIQLMVYLSYELKMLIMSYGERVRVDGPAVLRDDIKETVEMMREMYE